MHPETEYVRLAHILLPLKQILSSRSGINIYENKERFTKTGTGVTRHVEKLISQPCLNLSSKLSLHLLPLK